MGEVTGGGDEFDCVGDSGRSKSGTLGGAEAELTDSPGGGGGGGSGATGAFRTQDRLKEPDSRMIAVGRKKGCREVFITFSPRAEPFTDGSSA